MRLHFLKDFDGHKEGANEFVELSLGRRYCENGIAIPYADYLEQVEREKREAEEKAAAEKKAAEEQKAKDLLEKREAAKPTRATSTKASTRKKAVKPGA